MGVAPEIKKKRKNFLTNRGYLQKFRKVEKKWQKMGGPQKIQDFEKCYRLQH